jgi:rhamnose utilization protein RhaD (predicted bifunctional aldolase and dehydrogenase)/NAD(P)-dependent dehydrogenase (short-subunit alcohol dehydrogenase family)
MDKILNELIQISQYYGRNKDFVLRGGGNTSVKDKDKLYVKASGSDLADIKKTGFVCLKRNELKKILKKKYSENPLLREEEIKTDLMNSREDISGQQRPSVETLIHEVIPYRFVVHLHPWFINSLLCSKEAEAKARTIFGESVLFLFYTEPGFVLAKKIKGKLDKYLKKKEHIPKVVLVENHGVFAGADTTSEIKQLYTNLHNKLQQFIKHPLEIERIPVNPGVLKILPAIRMIVSKESLKVIRIRNHSLAKEFYKSLKSFSEIEYAFIPDQIVYCKTKALFLEKSGTEDEINNALEKSINRFTRENGYLPKVILIKNIGLIGIGENSLEVETILDIFEDAMKIAWYSRNFGGPSPMKPSQAEFIENWEVEKYRKEKLQGNYKTEPFLNKVVIVTGGGQGFGRGIVENFMDKGANVIIADIKENPALEVCKKVNLPGRKNKTLFVKTDVTDPDSILNMLYLTVKEFGGLDIFISNAGVLKAGGLEEVKPEDFEFVTDVNYKGYFLCAKYASNILKLQNRYNLDYYTDIIQINSKSGLTGSNKNFAYAGGKFGGIGLTQSFALELVEYNIKVNSICPGNFFDGPLWSDPKTGLFVQYLKAGKVPGAKTIGDVKKHYENQVPMKRGCTIEDLMRAICYVIEQKYETGQAIPVTGGQIMLS